MIDHRSDQCTPVLERRRFVRPPLNDVLVCQRRKPVHDVDQRQRRLRLRAHFSRGRHAGLKRRGQDLQLNRNQRLAGGRRRLSGYAQISQKATVPMQLMPYTECAKAGRSRSDAQYDAGLDT